MCKEKYAADLDRTVMPGIQGGPLMHIIAAKAVAFKEAMSDDFKDYQKRILENARTMSEELKARGYHIVSGGTDTHLFLMSFLDRDFSGKKVEKALDKAGITVNKNTVPFDTRKPFVTSGIRIGTPALTTRGMGVEEMKTIADFIDRAIINMKDDEELDKIRLEVKALCDKFPLYPGRKE